MGKFIDAYNPSHSTKKLATDFIKYVAQERARIEAKKKRQLRSKQKQRPFQAISLLLKTLQKKNPTTGLKTSKSSTVRLRTAKSAANPSG